jgi:hypothetical protein
MACFVAPDWRPACGCTDTHDRADASHPAVRLHPVRGVGVERGAERRQLAVCDVSPSNVLNWAAAAVGAYVVLVCSSHLADVYRKRHDDGIGYVAITVIQFGTFATYLFFLVRAAISVYRYFRP